MVGAVGRVTELKLSKAALAIMEGDRTRRSV